MAPPKENLLGDGTVPCSPAENGGDGLAFRKPSGLVLPDLLTGLDLVKRRTCSFQVVHSSSRRINR